MPRKIGELELDFEIPTWNSNGDFEEAREGAQAGREGGGWAGRVGF